MKHLIMDYYRRWSLVLAIGAALQLILGWWTTVEPKTPIEFTAMVIPLCVGEILALFDRSRGVFRILGTLPLTPGQIGRSWWLASVLIPSVILTVLLFLGAGAAVFCHPGQSFPLHRLSMASLFTVLWLGLLFDLLFPATSKFANWWQRSSNIFIVLLTVFLVFWMVIRAISSLLGFLLSPAATTPPVKPAIFLVGGTLLTFAGWFRAGRFDPARVQFGCSNTGLSARFYANKASAASFRLTPLPTAPHQPPEGHGGILFLLRTTFIDGFLVCFAGAIGGLVVLWLNSRFAVSPSLGNLREVFKIYNPTTVLLIFTFFPLQRSLIQLRFLRTLPISTAKFAAVMIASIMLPAIAAGVLMAGIAGLSIGSPAALTILKSCILILAPLALCVFFNVWRGGGIQAYALFIAVMMVWTVLVASNITFPLAGGVAVAGVMLAWLLTYYALLRGGPAYRAQTNPLGRLFTRTAGR